MLFIAIVAKGQNKFEISGTVKDKDSKTVISGVLVKSIKGQDVLTDEKGVFTISTFQGDTLTFNFLGYESQHHVVRNNKNIAIELDIAAQTIDEVVVVGYGVQRKEMLTGSVSYLGGRVAGVAVNNRKGLFGRNKNIMIRGVNTSADAESYKGFDENKFISPTKEALSTFAADVDVASYNNVKRFTPSRCDSNRRDD
jgi:Ca-activated chloride channel family protein